MNVDIAMNVYYSSRALMKIRSGSYVYVHVSRYVMVEILR